MKLYIKILINHDNHVGNAIHKMTSIAKNNKNIRITLKITPKNLINTSKKNFKSGSITNFLVRNSEQKIEKRTKKSKKKTFF